jgi:ornithine carbamoyltransferase
MVASPPRHFLQFGDFSRDEFDHLFERTRWIKTRFKNYDLYQPLRDRTLAMVFEKASTRTRVSFEAGMNQLGGIAINLNRGDTQLARGEPIEDVARVVSRMVDVVMIRTFEQSSASPRRRGIGCLRACWTRGIACTSTIRRPRAKAPIWSRPTCGRAWASRPKTRSASARSRIGASTPT